MIKRKIIYIIRTIILSLIISFSTVVTSYAEVDTGSLQEYFNGIVSPQQVNQSNNPKYAERNNSSETIDPVTGNLILKQTDLYLTGKDGFDLSVGRIYNSSQDESEKKVQVTFSIGSRYAFSIYGINNGTGELRVITAGPYQTESDARIVKSFYDNWDGSDGWTYSTSDINTILIQIPNVNNYTDKYGYNTTRYNLGAGWSFAFPSLQIINEVAFSQQYLYFYDGTGASYYVTSIFDYGGTNLDGYQGKDVKFLIDYGKFVNEDNIPSKYKFIDSDMTTTYFGEDGRLLGKVDRFGNTIKFRHVNKQIYDKTFPLISQITDSIGRIITFTYSGSNIILTVTAPNEANQINVTYNREMTNKTVVNNGITDTYQYPILKSVTDPLENVTNYDNYYYYNNNTWPNEKFLFDSMDLTNGASMDRYLLGAVVYQGSKTIYNYEKVYRKLRSDGATDAYRVKSRYDENYMFNKINQTWNWISNFNKVNYTYDGDYTMCPITTDPNGQASYRFSLTGSVTNGISTTYEFNGLKQQVRLQTTASNNEKKIIKYLEFDTRYKYLPTKIESTEYASDGTLARTLYTGSTYTDWGGLSTSTLPLTSQQYNDAAVKPLYTTTYFYENPTYKYFVTKKQWYQNSSKLLSESYGYDSLGRVSSMTNAKLETTTYSYSVDSSNNKIIDSSINIENGKTTKTREVYGSETGYAYPKTVINYYTNDQGVLTQKKTDKTYNMLLGLVETETVYNGSVSQTTTYTYDNAGRVTLIQMPGFVNNNGINYSVKQEYQYIVGYNNEYTDGNYTGIYGTTVVSKTSYTNTSNNTTSYYNQYSTLYDMYGNLRQESLWDTNKYVIKSKYSYDSMQRVISYTDATGNTISQTYNPWGQVKEVTDALGNLFINDYDIKANKVMSYFVAKNNITAYRANPVANTYKEDYVEGYLDQFGRTTSRKVYQNWPTLTGELSELYYYDIIGNLTGYIDPKRNLNGDGYTATYKYDQLNRVAEVKDALNQLTTVTYNILGNISSVVLKDSLNSKTVTLYTKSYDELGNIKSKTDAVPLSTSFSYNSICLTSKVTDRNGSSLNMGYDGLNQLVETYQISSNNASNITHRYNYSSPLGYDTEQLYNNGVLATSNSYTYNAGGQITQKNITGSGYINSNLKMLYDAAGNLTSIGAGVLNSSYYYTGYTYANNRLSKVQTNGQLAVSTSDLDNASYEYNPDGKLKKITYPKLNDGTYLTTEYSYNVLGRLTSMYNKKGSTILSQFTYTYDANGNIATINDGKTTTSYVYDKLNRLTEIQPQAGNKTVYTYDLGGNRLTKSSPDYSFNFVNTTYTYDLENKLTSMTKGTATTSMAYYADGLRSKKATGSGSTYYVYDLSGRVVAEGQSASAVSSNYVWGPDRVLSKKVTGGSDYYYLYNGHGDVIQIVDRNGNVVNNYKYDEWGSILQSTETISNPFKYAGEVYDQETGLYYLRARYYDPSVGRFINEDTVEGQINNPLSLNLYTYCFNNPMNFTDPSGNMPVELLNFGSWMYNKNLAGPKEISTYTICMNIGNIYNGFHEIAQLNLAKSLYNLGYSPILEYPVPGVGEADVYAGGMAWEIKPSGTSGLDQLNEYLAAGSMVAGHEFAPILDIPVVGKYKMGIVPSLTEPGVANYFFYYKNKNGDIVEVPSVAVKKEVNKRAWLAGIVVGSVVVVTVAEDFATAGAGTADDAASIVFGLELGAAIIY